MLVLVLVLVLVIVLVIVQVLVLVVVAFGEDLLACGPQQNGVFELRGVAAADVAQRGVRTHDLGVHERL